MKRVWGLLIALVLVGAGLIVLFGGPADPSKGRENDAVAAARVIGETDQWVFGEPERVSWLDNDTLVFIGAPRAPGGLWPSNLYVWHLGSKPQIHAADRWPRDDGYVCADAGRITYSAKAQRPKDDGEPSIYDGPLGAEALRSRAPVVGDRNEYWSHREQANHALMGIRSVAGKRCDEVTFDQFLNHDWVANYSRSTVLDFGMNAHKATEAKFLTSKRYGEKFEGAKSVYFDGVEVNPRCVETPVWDDSFMVWDCGYEHSESAVLKIARIDKYGHVTTLSVRSNPEVTGLKIVPFRDGYLGISSDEGAPKGGGLYVVRDGGLVRLVKGAFTPAAISPSGCKIALSEYEADPLSHQHLKVVEICKDRVSK